MLFKRIAEGLDVAPLVAKLAASPELWGEITARQDTPGSAHKDTEAIFLRWCESQTVEACFNEVEAVDYPAASVLMPEAGVVFKQLLDAIGEVGRIGRVMIVNLKPGGHVTPHMDEGRYADFYDRFHVCLSATPESNVFRVGRETFQSVDGEAFWFNHKVEHEVWNDTECDRLHMIVDVEAPAFKALRGVYYQRERARDLWPEITPLLEQHWQEIAHYQDVPLEPDVERYNTMDDAGMLRCFTARDCGRLVGYAIFFCGPMNMHYKSLKVANQDVLFVAPEYRRGRVGLRLIDFCEKRLAEEGVQAVYHHVKAKHPALGRLVQSRGYELIDEIYAKRL